MSTKFTEYKGLDLPKIASEILDYWKENKIFEKVLYHEAPKRYEYKLTEKGLALYPIIVSMSVWGNLWQNEDKQFPELRYLHKSCGNVIQPTLSCNCCGQKLDARLMSPVYFTENIS